MPSKFPFIMYVFLCVYVYIHAYIYTFHMHVQKIEVNYEKNIKFQ